MKIATWNVNSIKQRTEHLQIWLKDNRPDIVFLQELKGEEFPAAAFSEYQALIKSQKAYNGVAVLSQEPAQLIFDRLAGDDADMQARYLEVEYHGVRLINLYLPNGNPVGTDKYVYKLAWLDRLIARLKILRAQRVPFLLGGDFNIIPADEDCFDPALWSGDALYYPDTRRKYVELINLGLTDAFRIFNRTPHQYSFWDYQAGAWPRNLGIRIDHFLLSPAITDRAVNCWIDRTLRSWEKPSDHTPVLLEIT